MTDNHLWKRAKEVQIQTSSESTLKPTIHILTLKTGDRGSQLPTLLLQLPCATHGFCPMKAPLLTLYRLRHLLLHQQCFPWPHYRAGGRSAVAL